MVFDIRGGAASAGVSRFGAWAATTFKTIIHKGFSGRAGVLFWDGRCFGCARLSAMRFRLRRVPFWGSDGMVSLGPAKQ